MTKETTTTSRRALIAGLAALPALGVAGQVPAASGISSGLAEKITAWRSKCQQVNAFDATRLNPAFKAWRAAFAKIPHRSFPELSPALWGSDHASFNTVSTETSWIADMARRVAAGDRIGTGANKEWRDAMLTIHAAHEERKAEEERLERRFRVAELQAESDRMLDESGDLLDEALHHPADSFADLAAKLDILEAEDAHDADTVIRIVRADMQRLATGRT
ncbi:hypothetical protein ACFSCW_03480 [Sphingomonas tabacisoli]|uniref:Secreted protein n=1 Tax=Sphingomonas tabacisoli TaxID=2249466 RepID=A0ABW4HYY9_9SPHN